MVTHDVAWLKETGYALISGVARYYASRCTDDGKGGLIFKDASGPDESGASNSKRGGSVYIAALAKILLLAATTLAPLAGDTTWPAQQMLATAAKIVVTVNQSFPAGAGRGPARTGGWHPEYSCTGEPTCDGAGFQVRVNTR